MFGFFQSGVITEVFDHKVVGLAVVSVGLFILASVYQMLINMKLEKISSELKETRRLQEEGTKSHVEQTTILDRLSQESHEQWDRLNTSFQLLNEINLRAKDLTTTVGEVSKQQLILATAQLQQTQSTQKVIDGLVDVLQEHAERA